MIPNKLLLAVLLYFSLYKFTTCLKNSCPLYVEYPIADASPQCTHNPDVLSSPPEMAKHHNYEAEVHSLTTEDRYILTLFRIKNSESTKGAPVFIQHGITTNSGVWTDINNRSLAFNLVDKGYDVWLGNVRGTRWADKHKNMTENDSEYWEFNLDTVTKYDIRDQLKFIFDKTSKKAIYVGHSMGTTLSFMFASDFTQEADQFLKGIIAMAPVVYLDGVPAIELVKSPGLILVDILDTVGIKGLLYQDFLPKLFTTACKLLPHPCVVVINAVFGITTQFQPEDLLLYYSYWPDGTSIFELKQYLQIADKKRFQKYDYGSENPKKYDGASIPPRYNLSNINLPVCLLYGENDSLYAKKNLERLYNELENAKKSKHAVPPSLLEKFDHIDFMYPAARNQYKTWFFEYCLESEDFQSN